MWYLWIQCYSWVSVTSPRTLRGNVANTLQLGSSLRFGNTKLPEDEGAFPALALMQTFQSDSVNQAIALYVLVLLDVDRSVDRRRQPPTARFTAFPLPRQSRAASTTLSLWRSRCTVSK